MLSRRNSEILQRAAKDPEISQLDEEEKKRAGEKERKKKNPEAEGRKQEDFKDKEPVKKNTDQEKSVEELHALLEEARANLASKKGELKEFEMLFVGRLKGMVHGERKANIQKEYDDSLKKYQEARAQYVVGDVSKMTEERIKLAEAFVEAKGESKEHFLYKGYKWLGEQNVAKLFGEKFGWNIPDDFSQKHPFIAGAARVAGNFLSVRTAISLGLLGSGLMVGAGSGLAVGMGIVAGRAFMRGIGTAIGSHDMLKAIGATAWESKGTMKFKKEAPWYKKVSLWEKLTPEEIGNMSKENIEERLANMEANALLHNKKVSESDVYKELLNGYEHKLKQEMKERGSDAFSAIRELAELSDSKRDELIKNKRITHEVAVSVFTAAMVVLPGLSQFQRVIDKNAVEWAAVTKGAKEVIGMPAAEAHPLTPGGKIDIPHMVTELKDKAVKFAIEGSDAKHAQPLTIQDLEHIRNIASHADNEGAQMKSLLAFIEKKNLLEQSDIKAVTLDGAHATPYSALQEAAQKNPEYFKDVSMEQRAHELAVKYGVTVEQLKTLSHPRETFYFSKGGVIITQNESLVGQGVINRAHEAVGRAASGATAEHARPIPVVDAGTHAREHGHVRGVQHIRETIHPQPVQESIRPRPPASEVPVRSPAQPPEPISHGEIVIEEQPATGSVGERIEIKGIEVKEMRAGAGAETEQGGGAAQRMEIKVEESPAGQTADTAQKLEMRSEGSGKNVEVAEASASASDTEHTRTVQEVAGKIQEGKVALHMENFYGGRVIGNVQFHYDANGTPISFRTDVQMFGVGGGALDNKFLYHGWGHDKTSEISARLAAQGSRMDTNLLRDMLEVYNRQLAFDIQLYENLTASGHKPEAECVVKVARQMLNKVREYKLDEFLIHKENLPDALK
jgi:hypothetical protein